MQKGGAARDLKRGAKYVPCMSRPQKPARALAWPTCIVLAALVVSSGCASRPVNDPFRLVGSAHYVDGFSPITEGGRVNVVIEIPTGTLAKWEVDKADGALAWQFEDEVPRVVQYLGYPGNYGMIPGTYLPKNLGGDGDPLDVLVLGTALERGAVVSARLIGVMEMLDGGEQDDKLIAVLTGTPFEQLGSVDELDDRFPGIRSIVETWFGNYKGRGKVVVTGFRGPQRALEILNAAIDAYDAARPSDPSPTAAGD